MRGVIFDGELEVTDGIEVRDPNPDEVIVRIAAAGVCHSDLSVVNGTIPFPTPVVLGHEGAGVVEEVGSAVSKVKPGDHVVVTTVGHCGQCPACERFAVDHQGIDDDLFARLRERFDDDEILDLTLCCAVFVGLGRTLEVLQITDNCPIDL